MQNMVRRLDFVDSKCEQAFEQKTDMSNLHLKKGNCATCTTDFGELARKREIGQQARALAHTR